MNKGKPIIILGEEIDKENLPKLYEFHGRNFNYDQAALNEVIFPRKYYPKKKKLIPVEFVEHHLAHAASVYCCRVDDSPLGIAVLDGGGECSSVSIFLGKDGKIKHLNSFLMLVSPGVFYEAGCQ